LIDRDLIRSVLENDLADLRDFAAAIARATSAGE
jgi:hypothetical protein